ncbi:MAG: DUF1269 domain-containing protein [Pyrinomonadaceae bacterium]
MSNLIVVGFKNDRYKANEVLYKLRRLDEDWAIYLDDAVAVYRGYDGELRVDQSYQLTTGEGAAWGTLWGSLIGLTLAIPFTAGATAPAAAVAAGTLGGAAVGAATGAVGAKWWKEDYGIADEFVRDVGTMIQPGDSAIFVLANGDPERAKKEFEGSGGKVLMTSVSEEQKAKIEKVLNQKG